MSNQGEKKQPETIELTLRRETAVWLRELLSRIQIQGTPDGARQVIARVDEITEQLPEGGSDQA